MARIARRADVATGNLYHYHKDKTSLFRAVIHEELIARMMELLQRRVNAAPSPNELSRPIPGDTFWLASKEVLAFVVEHRWQVVILLGRAAGTPYEHFADELVSSLMDMTLARHSKDRTPADSLENAGECGPSPARVFVLRQLYRTLITSTVAILCEVEDPASIREAMSALAGAHLAAVEALLREEDNERT